jgi:uncharacterized protein YjbI with pentapeptide repeats
VNPNEQAGGEKRPPDDFETWKAYWTTQGMPWRTEPEIDQGRQYELSMRRDTIKPDIQQGIYPFKDVEPKLTRADVEWLLATHENNRGPVIRGEWERVGLDLRGADLSGIDLSHLPLAGTIGGLDIGLWSEEKPEQRRMAASAAIHLEHANLTKAQLWWAMLDGAHLEGANFKWVSLYLADVRGAHLESASLFLAYLQANLYRVHLEGVDLRFSFLDRDAYIAEAHLTSKEHGTVFVADVRWGDVNLSLVNWTQVHTLGDEELARRQAWPDGKKITDEQRLFLWSQTVRAYRQLAVVLRTQGMNEVADRFAYRAQLCQRVVLRRQRYYPRYLGSMLLWLISGYGYKPFRSFLTYILVVLGFATAYILLGPGAGVHFLPLDAAVFSITSFHGRGFMPSEPFTLHSAVAVLAAAEAIIGLVIEITFIATFTQRFFAR